MSGVPVYLTTFIGREHELEEVKRLLQTVRLLTLTGPGGCGKTRLAAEVVAAVSPQFRDSIGWVELVGLSDPALLPSAVARTLELQEIPGQPLTDTLSNYLRSRQLLLVLDNCEHLVAACAQLAQTLLSTCPHLRILATSREALAITGETVWLVPSLSLPTTGSEPPADHLEQYDAIRLFTERAAAALPTFTLTDYNRAAVRQVCQCLDGIPLAIELAAARVRLLRVEQIAMRLDSRFRLLTTDSPMALPRHQTLHAAIDWSHDLLTAPEQVLFRRLSVFAGGFTLEAAEAICANSNNADSLHDVLLPSTFRLLPLEVLDLLERLVNRSLVMVAREPGKEAHYHLLETIRLYAMEKLQESGEAEPMHSRHLAFFLNLAETAGSRLNGPEEMLWLARLEAEHDNFRAALRYSTESQKTDVEQGLQLAAALAEFWLVRGYVVEGCRRFERALDKVHLASLPVQAKVLLKAGLLLQHQGDIARALKLYQDSLVLYRGLDDKRGIAWTLRELGFCAHYYRNDFAQALSLLEESLTLAQELDDRMLIASVYGHLGLIALRKIEYDRAVELCQKGLSLAREVKSQRIATRLLLFLGTIAMQQGDCQRATPLAHESLALARELRDWLTVGNMLLLLGECARLQGDYEQAARLYNECLVLSQKFGVKELNASALHNLGQVALHQGKRQRAATLFGESIALSLEAGFKEFIIWCLAGFGGVAAAEGQAARAAWLLGAAEALLEAFGLHLYITDQVAFDRNVAVARAQLDTVTFAAAWAEGRAMSLEQATAYALEKDEGKETKDQFQPSAFSLQPSVTLRLFALGPARVYRGDHLLTPADWSFAKPKELLFYLLCHPPKTKEQIGLVFWPDASPSQLRNSVRTALYHLRRALGRPDWIIFADGRYAFNRSLAYWFDVEIFESSLTQAQRLRATEPEQAIHRFQEAIKLYQGDFLEDFTNDAWCQPRREELQRRYLEGLLTLGQLLFAAGRYAEAAEIYRQAIDQDNLLEEAHRGLMRCYFHLGERGQALRHYQNLVELLRDELQTSPERQTAALFERLRQGEES